MRRLFWMGVGAVGAVVLAQRARSAVKSLPEVVTDQVEQAGQRASSALQSALVEFRAARTEREAELVAALLVEPEGGTERRARTAGDRSPGARAGAGDPWDDDPWGTDEDDDA